MKIGKRTKTGWALLLAGLLLVSLSGCAPQPTEGERQLVPVSRGDLTVTVGADGSLSFIKDCKLVFGISGTIAEVNVEEGERVSQGTVLARLDSATLELAVKAAMIDLEIATNSFKRITYPYSYSTFAFDAPDAILALNDAKRGLDQALEALEVGLSSEQYWVVWHGLDLVQRKLTEAQEGLLRGYGVDVFAAGLLNVSDFWTLRTAQLNMEKAQLALDKANDDLAQAVMVAPFDGVIAAVNVKEGDSLSAMDYATRTIIELVDPAVMELNAEVDEMDVPSVKPGQRALINVDALPELALQGELISISPLATEVSGLMLYQIKVGFEAPEGSGLRAGMSATADIVVSERSNVLLVPSRAVEQDSQGEPVVKVMVNGQVEERAVVIGITDGYQTEVISGLNEGDTVVIEKKASSPAGLFGG